MTWNLTDQLLARGQIDHLRRKRPRPENQYRADNR
jgi:hypothetical protein